MKQLRPIARVIVRYEDKILLVRNKDAHFWYPPGGSWEFADESLLECARREVKEETNYDVEIDQLIWVSEFREKENVYLESFWKAHLVADDTAQHVDHTDMDANGAVIEVRWFTENDLTDLTVFPASLKKFSSFGELQYNAYVEES